MIQKALITAFGVIGFIIMVPAIIGAIGLFIMDFCLNVNVNWTFESMWVFGIIPSIILLMWGHNNG